MKIASIVVLYLFVGIGFGMSFYKLLDCDGATGAERSMISIVSGLTWPMFGAARLGELIANPSDIRPYGCARSRR